MNLPKVVRTRFFQLRYVGFFTAKEAAEKKMRLVTGREGFLCLYWLVDEADGILADVSFQVFGPPPLIVAADIVSELSLRKNYDQVSRFSTGLIEKQMKDPSSELPKSFFPFLNQTLSAIDHAVSQCLDIPFAATYEQTPIEKDFPEIPGGIAGFLSFSQEEKLSLIRDLIDQEIRPYVELDAGGVEVKDLREGNKVLITYQGSCTSCYAATGSTLSAIQGILRARIHPSLVVIPEL